MQGVNFQSEFFFKNLVSLHRLRDRSAAKGETIQAQKMTYFGINIGIYYTLILFSGVRYIILHYRFLHCSLASHQMINIHLTMFLLETRDGTLLHRIHK